jgi:hypothetical protein
MLAGHPSHAGDNQTALQQVIAAAIGAGGGTILIPTGTYYIEGPILINPGVVAMPPVTTPFTLNIVGTGQTRLIVTTAEDLFRIDNTVSGTNEDANAIVFQDLMIEYDTGGGANSGVAIKAGTDVGYSGARNLHLLRVTLFNCPQAVLLGNTKRVSIFDSIANYSNSYTGLVAPRPITIGGPGMSAVETFIGNAKLESVSVNQGGPGGQALAILNCEQLRVANVRIEAFQTAIAILPGGDITGESVSHIFLSNVTTFTGTTDDVSGGQGLIIQPQTDAFVTQVVCDGCTFQPGRDFTTGYTGGGILVDSSMTAGGVDQVRFVSCYSCNWPGSGIEITSGQNIEIIGGCYSGNGSSDPPTISAGVAIIGPATSIKIAGAACNNMTVDPSDGSAYAAAQDVGILVSGGPTNLVIEGCDLSGNLQYGLQASGTSTAVTENLFASDCDVTDSGLGPMDFSGVLSNIQITFCAGYNDRNLLLTSTAPTSAFNGTNFGYYGPVTFYVNHATVLIAKSSTMTGTSTGLTKGAFRLDPGEWGRLILPILPPPPTFAMIGV